MKICYEFNLPEFTKRLKTKRVIDLNIDMREMYSQSGVSIATISRVENGKSPDLDNFIKLCNWLGESPCLFFTMAQKPTKRKTVKK